MKKILFITLSLIGMIQADAQTKVINLRCEDINNPLGLEMPQPRLSWQLSSTARNVMQTSYRIIVADDPAKLAANNGNIWDTKQVMSDQSLWIPYAGKPLQSAHYYYWKVMVWDNSGGSAWADTAAYFQMGLMTPPEWGSAQWIGYDDLDPSKRIVPGIHMPGATKEYKNVESGKHILPMLRKSFAVSKPVHKATAFISGLGQYELHINGKQVGDQFMAPGWTDYDKRVLYNTFDVTSQITSGNNAIGVMLGNGFYNVPNDKYRKLLVAYGNPKLIMKLVIEYNDGTTSEVISDASWKAAPGPITYSSIYAGEEYDANLEQDGWDKASFNDAAWKNAVAVRPPTGKLVAELGAPVKVMQTIPLQSVKQINNSNFLFDFGQNASGIIRITVKGKKGQQIKFYPGELVKDDHVNQKPTGKPFYFAYTLKGTGTETWTPRFSYSGFRYIEMEDAVPDTMHGKASLPTISKIEMLHTHNSTPRVGKFETMENLFSDIYSLIDWAVRSNMQSVLTDCPHREKLGWLEESYLMGESIHFNYDVYNLYRKIVGDMMAAQGADGLVPDIAPEYVKFDGGFRDSPEWGSASVVLPWLLYQWYGDKTVMEQAYPMMTKYVDYLKSKASGNILSHGLGDWYDLGPKFPGLAQLTPKELTATAIWYYDISLLSKMAAVLNKADDAKKYDALGAQVKSAFNAKFFDAQTKTYSTGSQTAMAMPLAVGLVDDANKAGVMKVLTDSIMFNDNALQAGDIGFHFLVKALTDNGAAQSVYDMTSSEDGPGYAMQIKKGATALTESWAALEEVSNNHLMLGHLMEWFFNGLSGIRQEDTSVAYKHIIIKPESVIGISKGNSRFESPYGTIYSEFDSQYSWRIFTITIPANTTATLYLPSPPGTTILESNTPVTSHKEIQMLGNQNGREVFRIGSGKYKFIIKGGGKPGAGGH